MPKVKVNNVTVNYELTGRGDVLVLTHGLGGSIESWTYQVPAFAERHQVLAWDMRGFGASDKPHQAYTRSTFAADLSALLKALDIERAHILGHSLGGLVVQQFALDYPGQTRSLIVVDSSSEIKEQYMAGWERQAQAVEEKGFQALGFDPSFTYAPDFVKNHLDQIQQWRQEQAQNDPRCYAAAARVAGRQLLEDPLTPKLQAIRCPALIICGAEDRMTPPGGSVIMSRAIPGAKLQIIPGAGHAVTREKPGELNRAVLDFLATVP
ncbi:MAG: alpha/beta fold hydrolase [Chloroflexi bacterium]|nr:alpha/beta fold hydrolase [Chloroflexota bacterium]